MTFKAVTDGNPVYLGADGLPLAYGRLEYYEVDTELFRPVYLDPGRTVSLNPAVVYLDAHGRKTRQIFLGYGAYDVYGHKYFGGGIPDPLKPNDWAQDNQWLEWGLVLPVVDAQDVPVVTYDTIAALRAVNPGIDTYARVAGYYAQSDTFTRDYRFVPSDVRSDDGGYVIKPNTGSGSWLYRRETDIVSCEVFGVLANGTDCTSQIRKMALNTYGSKAMYYFPAGTYTVDASTGGYVFDVDLEIEDGCLFTSTHAGNFVLNMPSGYINGRQQLTAPLSVGVTYPFFASAPTGFTVLTEWWGLSSYYADESRFVAMLNGSTNCTIELSASFALKILNSDVFVPNPTVFANSYYINLLPSTHKLVFLPLSSITNIVPYKPALEGSFDNLVFHIPIQASWFSDPAFAGHSVDLTPIIKTLSTYMPTHSTFVLDCAINEFSADLAASYSTNLLFKCVPGCTLYNFTAGLPVELSAVDFGRTYCIASSGFVVMGQANQLAWWVPSVTASNDPLTEGYFQNALYSASNGTGELDLCQIHVQFVNGTSLANVSSRTTHYLTVCNGYFNIPSYKTAITDHTGRYLTTLRDIVSVGTTGSTLLSANTYSVLLDHVIHTADLISGFMVNSYSLDTVHSLEIKNSCATVARLASGKFTEVYIHDNPKLICDIALSSDKINVLRNRISASGTAGWTFLSTTRTIVQGNNFVNSSLHLNSTASRILATVQNNVFSGSTATPSTIEVRTLDPRTNVTSCITGNTFVGAYTAPISAIAVTNAILSAWDQNFFHHVLVADNTSASANLIVPTTRGTVTGTAHLTFQSTLPVPGYKMRGNAVLSENPGIFWLPGSIVGSIRAATFYSGPNYTEYGNHPRRRSYEFYGATQYVSGSESIGVRYPQLQEAPNFITGTVAPATITVDLYHY